MRAFFDTSAFAKRYIQEKNSDHVLELCQQTTELAISILSISELFSSLSRLRREQKINLHQYKQAKQAFLADIIDISLCNITPMVVTKSIELLENNALKTLDALQIACAFLWKAEHFISADGHQIKIAEKAGLSVIQI